MSSVINLVVGSGWVTAVLERPQLQFARTLRRWVYRGGRSEAPQTAVRVPFLGDGGDRVAAMSACEAALRSLDYVGNGSLKGCRLKVQLGFATSRVAMTKLDPGLSLKSISPDAIAQSWATAVLGLDSSAWIVKGQLARDRRLLVSAVHADVLTGLRKLADDHQLLFRSCQPAILAHPAHARGSAAELCIWSEMAEPTELCPIVQLLAFDADGLAGTWRGRLPPGSHELDTLAVRLLCSLGLDAGSARSTINWPAPVGQEA